MMDFNNSFFVLLMLTGGIFTAASILMIVIPPKKINPLYGYRTPSSMRSDERWTFAQKYSAKAMLQSGLGLIVISFIGVVPIFSEVANTSTGTALFVVAIAVLFYRTEKALKKIP